jgi:hypothetical protein
MGGFVEGSVPLGDPGLTPAPDVPPNNNFDPMQFWSALVGAAQQAGVPGATQSGTSDAGLETYAKELAALGDTIWSWVTSVAKKGETEAIKCMLEAIVVMEAILQPGRDAVGQLAAQYVSLFAADQRANSPNAGTPGASSVGTAAQAAFDAIMKPIGLLGGGANPANPGVGQANAEFVLGSLVNLHLNTWMVDVLHKMTGLGIFEWFHSFDEAIVGAMNTRGMARLAMKPFLNIFMQQPLTRDLNAAYPIAHGSSGGIVKDYLRGALTASQLQEKLSELGYGPDIVAQLLLDTQKTLSLEDVAWLVNFGSWTGQAAVSYLQQLGYSQSDASVVLYRTQFKLLDSIHLDTARAIVEQVKKRAIDPDSAQSLLNTLGFTQLEVQAFLNLATVELVPGPSGPGKQPKVPKPGPFISYGEVVRAYEAGILSLDDVSDYLDGRGYSDDDIQTLILLDFTKADQRALKLAETTAHLLVEQQTALEDASKATAAAETAKAAAYTQLAAAYANLAKSYGG